MKIKKCKQCGIELTEDIIFKNGNKTNICVSCGKKKQREWNMRKFYKNQEERKQYANVYYQKNRTDILEKHKKKYETDIKRASGIKKDVFDHYGGKCSCCGEVKFEFLTIDHINGGGHSERKKLGVSGWRLYKWIKEQDYPDRYRVLCMNCNFSIGMWGYCPHDKVVD